MYAYAHTEFVDTLEPPAKVYIHIYKHAYMYVSIFIYVCMYVNGCTGLVDTCQPTAKAYT